MTSTHDASARSDFAGIQALLSREPAQDVQIGIPGFEDEQLFEAAT
jgi:hypothetical protein